MFSSDGETALLSARRYFGGIRNLPISGRDIVVWVRVNEDWTSINNSLRFVRLGMVRIKW